MEKENEILLATRDGTYYESGSSQENVRRTLESNEEIRIESTGLERSPSQGIDRVIGATLTILQLIMIICSVLFLVKGILNIRKNKMNKEELARTEDEIYGDASNLKNHGKLRKKATTAYFISSAILFLFYNLINMMGRPAALKPIIYIYPEKEKKVKIKVKNPEKLICTYPKYEREWNVLAKPNGDLVDLETNRNLYALYWEGINTTKLNLKEGFIVEGENVTKFLEEKLEILGLNEREAEEFIVYWLPLMEKNKYNYIRFETKEEIDENMGLEITPTPETLIRINMEFKGLRKPILVEEQKLEKVERKGYTVVEWGGTRL